MKTIYACDDHYFRYAYVSIWTLLEHNTENGDLDIVFVEQDVSEVNLSSLSDLGTQFHREISIRKFSMPQEYDSLPAVGASKTTFAKFLFSSMFDDDKVLFIDPDTLILGDLRPMDEIDVSGCMFAGVIENLPEYHRIAAGMKSDESYINGGVVICNLKLWREVDFERQVLEFMTERSCSNNFDQGIINELCHDRIKIIPPKYNLLAEVTEFQSAEKLKTRYGFERYYDQREIDEALQSPVIIHFTQFLYGKPLMKKCTHPYTGLFQEYLDRSPLDHTLSNDDCNSKVKIRRWVLHHTPFRVYLLMEKILDIRRRRMLSYIPAASSGGKTADSRALTRVKKPR